MAEEEVIIINDDTDDDYDYWMDPVVAEMERERKERKILEQKWSCVVSKCRFEISAIEEKF